MAQQDTGLGWNAKEDWLLYSGPIAFGRVSDYYAEGYPNQPLPYCPTVEDVHLNGVFVGDSGSQSSATGRAIWLGSNTENAVIFVSTYSRPGTSTKHYMLYSTVEQFSIHYASKRFNEWYGDAINNLTGVYDSSLGLYSAEWQFTSTGMTSYSSDVIPYDDVADVIKTVDDPYIKLNPGFAVACFAKWYNLDGDELLSPILISSNADYATISKDGISPTTQARYSGVYNGINFTMSYIPLYAGTAVSTLPVVDLTQFGASAPRKLFEILASPSLANILVGTAPDPYSVEGGGSEEEGGGGDDPDDDPVEEETLPIPAVVGLGFSTIYVPTQTDLYNLAAYLWGGNLDLDNFLKLFATPMDSILGLSAVPLVLSGTYEPIYLGGQQLQGITMPRYTGRTAVKVDMGTVTIKERWGSYLDYDPYTELAVYVPFVGIKNIKADDVMGKTVRLMYDIDILSGACIAYLRPEGGSPLYEWSGQCAMQIPITGANWDNIFNSAIHTVATLGGALFAPASAPVLGGAVASAASQAIAAKPRIERSGAMNGVTGFLGQLRPYIIRTIPEAYIPNDQNKFIGYPSYVSVNLGSLTGYNEIASIHLENIHATGDELSELESILKGGAIF